MNQILEVKRNVLNKGHNYLKYVLILISLFYFDYGYSTDYVWVGTTSAWATSSNWVPLTAGDPAAPAGGPTSTDRVFINSVVAPKLAPIISTNVIIQSLTITAGRITVNTNMTLTITGSLTVTGVVSKILGAGKLNLGTSSLYADVLSIGSSTAGITIDPALITYCNSVVLTKATFKAVTIETGNVTIVDCAFTGIINLTMNGTSSGEISGTFTSSLAANFSNTGAGALLFGNSDIDNFTFTGATTVTNAGSGSILFGNSDNDLFAFKAAVTFTKSTAAILDVARFGNTDFFGNLTFNAPSSEENILGNSGGGVCSFKGSVAQTITGSASALKFNKITIDKALGNVTLQLPVNLIAMPGATRPAPQLNLLGGLIVTTNNTTPAKLITVPDGTAIVLNADPNKSFISGPVRKSGISAFTFPVGKGTFYRPISIDTPIPEETSIFTAEYFNTVPPSSANLSTDIPTLSSCEYWKLQRDDGTSNVVTTLSWPLVNCEAIQPIGLKFCKFNTVSNKWETVAATQNDATSTLVSNSELTTYGNVALGYSSKRIYVDTRGLDPIDFTITGAQLPTGVVYTSGKSGPAKDGLIPLLPVLPATGTSPIVITMPEGNGNEAMKISFDIDNVSVISNVNAITDNTTLARPLANDFYTVNNTPANGKIIKFLKGDELVTPVFTTNLTDGTVLMNSSGSNFLIQGLTGYTISSFKILNPGNELIKGPTTAATWDGTDLNNQEVSNGIYKFELIINNNSHTYTYNGQIIVK